MKSVVFAVAGAIASYAGCATNCAPRETAESSPPAETSAVLREGGVTGPMLTDAGSERIDASDGAVDGDDGGAGTIRFIAVGDTGRGNVAQSTVADAMAAKCRTSGCDFAVLLGDNFYMDGVSSVDDPQWTSKFEDVYRSVNAPFYAILGNHDYGGAGAGNEFARGQFQVDYTARSTKWRMPAAFYSHRHGPAQFFAADSNMQVYGRDADQRTEMSAWIRDSRARWKIAFAHHPYRSNGPHGNAGSYDGRPATNAFAGSGVKSFDEQVLCGNVDVLFTGHDHARQWMTDTCGGTELIVSGTGAEGTSLPGSEPTRFQSTRLGFAYVTVTRTTLTVDFLNELGAVEFSRTKTKPER